MIIAGAGGHAKDLVLLLSKQLRNIVFLDNLNNEVQALFLTKYPIIQSKEQIDSHLQIDNTFIIGIGGTYAREKIENTLSDLNGKVQSIISTNAVIGEYDVTLGKGLNIMPFVIISNAVNIGDGCLINSRSSLHHDVSIGVYCDIGPSSTLLGGAKVGNYTSIGSGTIILPNVIVGNNCKIGAGSVITKDIPDNSLVIGVPGKIIKELSSI